MAHTGYISRILTRRLQFNFPSFSWVIPNLNIHTDNRESSIVPVESPVTKDKDILLSNIRKANSSGELFNIIAAHGQLFNQKHVIESLSCLHEFNKAKEFDASFHNVMSDPVFEKLCIQLKKFSRILELNEIIEALKVLTLMKVPSNSTIFQMLLQLIRSNINNLELEQIVFLDYILKKCETNHLIDAIQLALPLVFQLNISSKMDGDNMAELTKLLRYTSVNNVPMNCVTSIVTAFIIHRDKVDISSAKGILYSLSEHRFKNCRFNVVHEKLITRSMNVLIENIHTLTFLDMLKILERIKEMMLLNHSYFYNAKLFDACGDYVVSKNLPFISAIQIARIFTRVAHCHLPLLEYISQLFALGSQDMKELRPKHLFTYTSALSNANYIPDFFEEIKENLLQNSLISSNTISKIELPWSKFGMDLAVLNVYNESLVNKIFNKEFLAEFLSRKNSMIDHLQLLIFYQAVKTFNPSFTANFPVEIFKKAAGINCSRDVDPSMKTTLTRSLGGEEYLGSQVQMPLGIFADFIVAFRDGVYPMAINPDCKEGPILHNELDLPARTNVLCILNYHKGCYSINNGRIRGQFSLINKSLEKLGYKVLPFSLTQWQDMPDIEKTLYLMQEIKYKYSQDEDVLSNNKTIF